MLMFIMMKEDKKKYHWEATTMPKHWHQNSQKQIVKLTYRSPIILPQKRYLYHNKLILAYVRLKSLAAMEPPIIVELIVIDVQPMNSVLYHVGRNDHMVKKEELDKLRLMNMIESTLSQWLRTIIVHLNKDNLLRHYNIALQYCVLQIPRVE